ncbi:3-deoxy-8-phosphooctulonate synthase [Profundibacterium mesophilum]|uniref:2-dehydro-3-deoxyphosphooctonate aldolase n=1 Tax=Profundibacterium mesophilum KAUST100406-0324 TaxID=1037889 RepID=A0A921TFQ0_9RHOB|nr:3-deoxy-8-phosphooctulonate synthase [Profundibacterium mesophilum]KAF0676649.1 2-dehydro-3-deoxyphosphooctonate aldolase [Profundibacterium mesophilum KAUST100406-0324]
MTIPRPDHRFTLGAGLEGACTLGPRGPLTVIAGPCQLQSADHAQMIAGTLQEICACNGLNFVFKASFDKANRSAHDAERGPGAAAGLGILRDLRKALGVPVTTDLHLPEQAGEVAEAVDLLQIPAFLSRQSDLLAAAAATGRPVNVKKGQFLAPWDMEQVVGKLMAAGGRQIALTERGSSFGYNRLVADLTGLPRMAETGCPVIMDATHAVQLPGGAGHASGGRREDAPALARAAVAVGVSGIFLETHEDPASAPSDGAVMQSLSSMPALLEQLARLHRLVSSF